MKTKFIILFFSCFFTNLSAQDTIIQKEDFTLEVSHTQVFTESYKTYKTNKNFETADFFWTNRSLSDIVDKWIELLEMETIDYRIEGKIGKDVNYYSFVDTAALRKAVRNGDTDIVMTDFITIGDSSLLFFGYDVVLTIHNKENREKKAVHKEAFEAFAAVVGLELQRPVEEQTFWILHIVDLPNATISADQNKFWKRTDFENYTLYETIDLRRIADLLSRKLDAFVKPIPYNTYKFDIKIPTSNLSIDLQYAMQEHGLELIQVREAIEVLVIKANSQAE